jgi:hypothetical protein
MLPLRHMSSFLSSIASEGAFVSPDEASGLIAQAWPAKVYRG